MGFEIHAADSGPRKGPKVRQRILFLLVGMIGVLVAGGCGYTTQAYVKETGYQTIYIEPFVNKINTTSEFSEGSRFQTYFPLLEQKITNAVVDQYILDGTLKVSGESYADVALKGEVINYRRESLRDSSEDVPQEYRVTVFVNITLMDRKTQKVLWEKKDFAGDATYFTTGQFVKSDAQGVDEASKDLARRIVEATVEAW